MPIYEFYCDSCNTIFNFFSRTVNTTKKPKCPKCNKKDLQRRMSAFAIAGKAKEDDGLDDLPFDESKMEQAMNMLAGEAEKINRQPLLALLPHPGRQPHAQVDRHDGDETR